MTDDYFRPLPMTDAARPADALRLAGGWCWFDRVERLSRGAPPEVLSWREAPPALVGRWTDPRPELAGLTLDRPRLMGILNVTPDSFSDGGRHLDAATAIARAREMTGQGAELIDIGGESTRPGAEPVDAAEELARVIPVVQAVAAEALAPVSIDTRKGAVAEAALAAGAAMVNDVSALTHDPSMAPVVAAAAAPLCLMHARGEPRTMQDAPAYDDVLLDVYDWLAARIAAAEAAGIPRASLIADPGIGFGKTLDHNLALLRRLSLFHGLGVPLLVGTSRKRFIGVIGGAPEPADRAPGSLATALHAVAQGVQIVRVHDIDMTRQGLALWTRLNAEGA